MDTADTVTAGAPARAEGLAVDALRTSALQADPPVDVGDESLHQFGAAAGVAATLLCLLVIWMASHAGAHRSTAEIDAVVKLVVATLATASCVVFGRRATPQVRLAWMWIGTFAAVWAVGAAVLTWYEFARNGVVPFPSPADAGFLAALPIAAIGVMLFSSAPVSLARMLLDGAIVAGSLLIVSWSTALGTVYHSGSGSVFSQAIGLAYPISDVIVATVGVSVLAQGRSRQRVAPVLVVAGLLCLTVADSSLTYVSQLASFRYDMLVDAGRVAGFILIALAPLWPPKGTTTRDEVDGPSPWQVALPYLFLAIAIFAAALKDTQSGHLDLFDAIAGLCVIAAVLTRLVLTLVENLRLTSQMRYAVTTLRANQVELVHYALHDSLTGLPNRVLFGDRIEHALARRSSPTSRVAVMLCDLDSFKDVNDTLGHPTGDRLLQSVAERLRSNVREIDTVARFGGDEFAAIAIDLDEPADAAVLADKLVKALAKPFHIDDHEVRTGASIGIAVFGPDSLDAEALLAHADVALYRAKADGRGTYRFYTDAMDAEVHERVTMDTELGEALESGQFFLVYQPQVNIETGRIVGLEALVRWHHPTRGVLEPKSFLAAAEKSGAIVELGRLVKSEACRQMKRWLDAGIAPPLISVNVSGVQFKAPLELENGIATILAETGLAPQLLELELTESVLMEASLAHRSVLLRLREMGLRLAIDDFGTGYSSLDRLRRFRVDRIKIPESFIAEICTNSSDASIVRASFGLARELDIEVVAEGVENAAQLALLKTWGCRIVQGYYFSEPLGLSEATSALHLGFILPKRPKPIASA